jgi:hypothetical protein
LNIIEQTWKATPAAIPGSFKPLEIPGVGRNDLPTLMNKMGVEYAAEIGVERAVFSRVLMRGTAIRLTLVDPWLSYPGYRDHVSQEKLDGFYADVMTFSVEFGSHGIEVMREFSTIAAQKFNDGSLDFVYIDANHNLPNVIADINAWLPKVRSGGIIAGHDYRKPKNNIQHHVVEAVNAWTYAYRVSPWYLLGAKDDPGRDQNRTWLWVNP